MMKSAIILFRLQATLHETYKLDSTWNKQWLIQDADEELEELKHPLQPRVSQERTTIFVTVDCRGGVSHATNVL